jgi:hypothetical protein
MSVSANSLAELGTEFTGADGRKTILLEPEKWIGKEFPLLKYIELGECLQQGSWLVVLVHSECSACKRAREEYCELVHQFLGCNACPSVAIVECPPYHTRTSPYTVPYKTCYLTAEKTWFVETPVTIFIDNGRVQSVFKDALLDISLLAHIWKE